MGEMVVALFSFLFQDWGDNQANGQSTMTFACFVINFFFSSWPSASPSSSVASYGSYFQSLPGKNVKKIILFQFPVLLNLLRNFKRFFQKFYWKFLLVVSFLDWLVNVQILSDQPNLFLGAPGILNIVTSAKVFEEI